MLRRERVAVMRNAAWIGWVVAVAAGLEADLAGAQLVNERLAFLPAQVNLGVGTVRLMGMGGFETAVADENLEINLYDFAENPAGFADDRDAWSIDFRYGHLEYREENLASPRNDVSINDGTFVVGYHAPRIFGVGGRIEYAEAGARDITLAANEFKIVGAGLIVSKYFFPSVVGGLDLGLRSEKQDLNSPEIYSIEHETSQSRAALGLGVHVAPGVTVGGRAEFFQSGIDGESSSSTHTDAFDWSRPGFLGSVHAFVDRGRLQAGVDLKRKDVEGEESARLSWSPRFIFNPTGDDIILETDTFSEDRQETSVRTRARLQVVPGLAVSGALFSGDAEAQVVTNPNAIGSLEPGTLESSSLAWIVGLSWVGVQDRLLLAGELKQGSAEVLGVVSGNPIRNERDDTTIRVGGEYLLGESVVSRAGVVRVSEDLKSLGNTGLNDTFSSWRLAAGLGLVPRGGVWQFDLSYEATLNSDLDSDLSRFGAYIRYLF